jgi:hypothetical protein
VQLSRLTVCDALPHSADAHAHGESYEELGYTYAIGQAQETNFVSVEFDQEMKRKSTEVTQPSIKRTKVENFDIPAAREGPRWACPFPKHDRKRYEKGVQQLYRAQGVRTRAKKNSVSIDPSESSASLTPYQENISN